MHVTIVGSGFAGVKAALELARDEHFQVHVITDKEQFQYYPTLYSSATGHSHLESWVSLGEIFARNDNIHVTIDPVVGIDAKQKQLIGSSETRYDYQTLIMAVGSVTSYFGIPGLDQYSYGIKSSDQIRQLKERIYNDLAIEKHPDKNYVIVGGGPTGVELAGALGTYLRELIDYYEVKPRRLNVRLIEAAPRLLPGFHEATSRKVRQRLELLDVEVDTGLRVEKETAETIIAGGRPIATHTVIWTSGVANHPLYGAHPELFKLSRRGLVEVDDYLRAHKDIYVLGDNADTPFSGLAQTALHDAKFVAANLKRKRRHEPLRRYRAVKPASAIPVGQNWAAFEFHGVRLYGRLAAFIRRAADFVGYSEILPIGQALRPWYATKVKENDFYAPKPLSAHAKHGKSEE